MARNTTGVQGAHCIACTHYSMNTLLNYSTGFQCVVCTGILCVHTIHSLYALISMYSIYSRRTLCNGSTGIHVFYAHITQLLNRYSMCCMRWYRMCAYIMEFHVHTFVMRPVPLHKVRSTALRSATIIRLLKIISLVCNVVSFIGFFYKRDL